MGDWMKGASQVVKSLAVLLACLSFTATAQSQTSQANTAWPKQPIRIVVTFTPGGAPDILARVLAESWQQSLGVPVLVENRPGYGGNIGAIERHTFDAETSARKRFVSGYTNTVVPNLWDRSAELVAG